MGRYSILAGFGIAFLTAVILNKSRKYIPFLILYLLLISIPTMNLLRNNIPYIREISFVKNLPENSLFVESHFALPQLEYCCKL